MPSDSNPTAAIVLIGDELLSGKVQDINGTLLIRELRALGVVVTEVHIVSDVIERIVEALELVRHRNDIVFTSGGIGPTHDDRTIEAVARVFEVALERRQALVELVHGFYGEAPDSPWLKMTDVPVGCELIFHSDTRWPGYKMDNVHVLPGIPEIFRRQFAALKSRFTGAAIHLALIYFRRHEGVLVPILNEAVERFDKVAIGSYPELSNPDYRVRVTFESPDRVAASDAARWVAEAVSEDVVRLELPTDID